MVKIVRQRWKRERRVGVTPLKVKSSEKAKVNMERILEEIQDFWKENNLMISKMS